jgi:N-acetylmuramoyl-L-alanine amidase
VRILTFIATWLLVSLPFYAQEEGSIAPQLNKIKTVVIDAGHGGKDSGSLGVKTQEKVVALKIAQQVGAYIKTYMPGVKVIYTRNSDVFIPLFERANIANKNNADVFISIHCNSLPPKKSHINGTETYVMGLHTAEENLAVAKRENEVILLEENYRKNYDGFDPNSPEAHIMLSMYQNAHLGQSILLAERLEDQFKNRVKRSSRGVKQAGFVVLKATSMPSVLVETGFLSNKTEELYLGSEKGQIYLASAIYRAFKEYKDIVEQTPATKTEEIEEVKPPVVNKKTEPAPAVKKVEPAPIVSNKVVYKVQLASSPVKLNTNEAKWKKVSDLETQLVDKQHKYLSGNFSSLKEAALKQTYWRQNGFADAFIVAYQGNTRITLAKAQELLGK